MSITLAAEDILAWSRVPESTWVDLETIQGRFTSEHALCELLKVGALINRTDETSGSAHAPSLAFLADRDRRANEAWWDPSAYCFYQLLTQEGQAAPTACLSYQQALSEAHTRADEYVGRVGKPPPTFYSHTKKKHPSHSASNSDSVVRLESNALSWRESPLGEVLGERRTNRVVDPTQTVSIQELAALLEAAFAPTGSVSLGKSLRVLRKTSPSGGSLHPIEAFVSAPSVDSLPAGTYHYSQNSHQLCCLEEIAEEKLRILNRRIANQQDFAANCAFLIILVARFARHFWKYRDSPKALSVIFTDAGHLSQTLYLSAAQLDLACAYSGAINHRAAADLLNLDQVSLGTLAIWGCGKPDKKAVHQEIDVLPWGTVDESQSSSEVELDSSGQESESRS